VVNRESWNVNMVNTDYKKFRVSLKNALNNDIIAKYNYIKVLTNELQPKSSYKLVSIKFEQDVKLW
jgi:hypothetical protein